MTTKRLATAGLVALAALTIVGACSTGIAGNNPATTARSANQILSDAAAKAKGQSYTFTLAWGSALSAAGGRAGDARSGIVNVKVFDPPSGVTVTISALLIGVDMYVKMDFGALGTNLPGLNQVGDKWMRAKASEASSISLGLLPGTSMVAADTILAGVVSAEKRAETEITGTIDLGKATIPGTSAANITTLPVANRIAPFTAMLDDQGRLAKIVITMPAVGELPAADLTATFAEYGVPVTVTKPAATEVVPAPDMIYQFLQ